MKKKTIVIGLDGATWDNLKEWIETDKLPFLKTIFKKSSYANLKSTVPPFTPVACSTIQTGLKLQNHGIFSFHKDIFTKESLINARHLNQLKIWDYTDYHNLKSCIINFPVTYPPQTINGIIVSSLLTPTNTDVFTSPAKYSKILKSNGYIIDCEINQFDKIPEDIIEQKILDMLNARIKCSKLLWDAEDWSLFLLYFRATDIVQHYFWHKPEIILKVYRIIDDYLKDLISKINTDYNLIFFSDHGFHRSYSYLFNIKDYLWQKKMLFKNNVINNLYIIKRIFNLIRIDTIKYIRIIPRLFLNILEKYCIQNVKLNESIIILEKKLFRLDKDYINFKKKLIEILENVYYKNKKVFYKYYDYDEMNFSKRIKKMFDLYGIENIDFITSHNLINPTFTKRKSLITGAHRCGFNAIFTGYGKNFIPGKNLNEISVLDILPIILFTLNIPIPNKIDSNIDLNLFNKTLFTAGYSDYTDLEKVTESELSYNDQVITERLRNLGYI